KHLLRVPFAPFQSPRLTLRSERVDARRAERIGEARRDRSVRPDHDQIHTMIPGPFRDPVHVRGLKGHPLGQRLHPWIARRREETGMLDRVVDRIHEGVLTPSLTDHEDPGLAHDRPSRTARSASWIFSGCARPPERFMAWPTRNPKVFCFPARYS